MLLLLIILVIVLGAAVLASAWIAGVGRDLEPEGDSDAAREWVEVKRRQRSAVGYWSGFLK